MTEGLRFVRENFGPEARPRVAWHIDPFGHSSEQAAIFARMGYDGFFFARIDYQDMEKRKNDSGMEMIWRGSPKNLGPESDIFTGVLFYHYNPPPNFCFDTLRCSDDALVTDPDLFTYNLKEKLLQFMFYAKFQANTYRTKNIMLTMGSDFQWENAKSWYANLDILIDNINKNYSQFFNLFYSTPTRYLEAVHAANLTWDVKTDDFFPYANNKHSYWTGFYTSRPALKGYVREMNSFLQTCRHFEQYVGGPGQSGMTSDKLAQAMGVAQHHDAVSGTEKQHVADDYAMRLHIGQVQCQSIIGASLNKYVPKEGSGPLTWEFCEYLNISVCPQSQSGSFNVLIYNPLVHSRDVYVRVPVATRNLEVMDGKGSMVPYDIAEVTTATKEVRGKKGDAPYNLFFIASTQSLSYTTYFIRAAKNSSLPKKVSKRQPPPPEPIISNDYLQVVFAQDTGHVRSISNMKKDITVMLNQQFFYYNASTGNKASHQASGAYIFRPNSSRLFYVNEDDNRAEVTVVNGKTYQEVQQVFSDYASQVVRLYKGANFVEFEYTIGPIPFSDGLGKEIISRFDTDLASSGMWYTDANGREMQTDRCSVSRLLEQHSTNCHIKINL
jgi:lysosomal alpha-mannosidase